MLGHEVMIGFIMNQNKVDIRTQEITADLHGKVQIITLLKHHVLVEEYLELSIAVIGRWCDFCFEELFLLSRNVINCNGNNFDVSRLLSGV